MQVSVENIQGLDRRVTITLPMDKIRNAVDKRLLEISKTARVDGFRKGKVPLSMVSKRYGASAQQEALSELMHRGFVDAVISENLNPASTPNYIPGEYKPDEDFRYSVEFEIYPAIELKGLEDIQVEIPVSTVTEEDIDAMLVNVRKQQATWKKKDGEITASDRVTLDFTGAIDGEKFEGGHATDFSLTMGQNSMIPGFEEGILGHKIEDNFDIDVTFPEDYQAENLKGKKAVFSITIKNIEESEIPELTQDFIKRFGITDGSIDSLRTEIRKNMERELKNAKRTYINKQVFDGLIDQNNIEVPRALIEHEINIKRTQAGQRFGLTEAQSSQLPSSAFEEAAKRQAIIILLMKEVIKVNDLKVDDKRVETFIVEMSSAYEKSEDMVEYYHNNKELMDRARSIVLEDQAVEAVLEKAKKTEKPFKFQEIMDQVAKG